MSYSTTDAANFISKACGHAVGKHFIHRVFEDLYGEKHRPGSGSPIRLTERQVDAIKKYAVVNYNRKPPVPIRQWLQDNGIAIPRLAPEMRESKQLVKTKRKAKPRQDTGIVALPPEFMAQIERLIEKKVKEIAGSVASTPRAKKYITDQTASTENRKYVVESVNRFVAENTTRKNADYQKVYSHVYRLFFGALGGSDSERWKVGKDYASTLDYIEAQQIMADLAGMLPQILDGLRSLYGDVHDNDQPELFK